MGRAQWPTVCYCHVVVNNYDSSRVLDGEAWRARVATAVERVGTPCYVSAWTPVAAAIDQLDTLCTAVPVRSWLSFKTHPLPRLASGWLRSGRGLEVVSEGELVVARRLGASANQILVNGVAKQTWLPRHPINRLRVHFDSLTELHALLPLALQHDWRVGVRCHVPGECDARSPEFGGQFGLNPDEAVTAIGRLREADADLQSIHFHMGQGSHAPDAYLTAVNFVADLCDETAFAPRFVDCGGGLPTRGDAGLTIALADLADGIRQAADRLPAVEEVWLENGRFMTEASTVLAIRVIDIKDRPESRYVICDGGRTNQALAADIHPHHIDLPIGRVGPRRWTTVCGPTCMTDDRLGRWELADDLQVGDVMIWRDAGAYHLPWETRFSQGHCAVVWFDEHEYLSIARERETPEQWATTNGVPCG